MAKILLIEDNEVNRDMLSRRLANQGDEVVVDGHVGLVVAGTSPRPASS
jgi:two-component system cell cycle response regulator DivK